MDTQNWDALGVGLRLPRLRLEPKPVTRTIHAVITPRLQLLTTALLPLWLTAALFAADHKPAHNKGEPAAESNLWVTPKNPPPLTPGEGAFVSCPDPLPESPLIVEKLDHEKESFYLRLPANFDPKGTYGVIVFLSAFDRFGCQATWPPILDERKLIYIAPQKAGNPEVVARRESLVIEALLLAQKYYHIDPKHTYLAGFSGGARVSGMLAFKRPELFRGTIQSCGADFYTKVPRVAVTDEEFKNSSDYGGLPPVTPAHHMVDSSRILNS